MTDHLARSMRYRSSQPWPFPSSVMLGFRAVASSEAIERGDEELEDARWFTRTANQGDAWTSARHVLAVRGRDAPIEVYAIEDPEQLEALLAANASPAQVAGQ